MGEIQDKVIEAKKWYLSKTIIGILLAFIPTLLKVIKPELVEVNLEGAVDEAFTGAELLAGFADNVWGMALAIFGSILAVYGRIKAHLAIK